MPPRFIGPQVFRPQVRIPIQALVSRPPPPLRAPGGQPGFRPVPGGQQGFRPVPGGQPGFRPVRGGQPGFRPTTVAPNPTIRPSLRIASPTSKFHFYRSYFHFYQSYIHFYRSYIHFVCIYVGPMEVMRTSSPQETGLRIGLRTPPSKLPVNS